MSVDVVIAVPPGSRRPEPLVAAIGRVHPEWRCLPVWAGDPQLRPRLSSGATWHRVDVDEGDLLRVEPDGLPWLVALTALATVERPTIVIVCGTAVLDDLSSLVPRAGEVVFVPKTLDAPSGADLHPSVELLADEGAVTSSVAGFGEGTQDTVEWIRRQLMAPTRPRHVLTAGRVFELAAGMFASRPCIDPRIGASVWRWPVDPPALVDLPHFDHDRPWLADPTLVGAPRITLGAPERLGAIERAADQLAGTTEALRLPGGIEIDETIRRIARRRETEVLRPWSDAAAFRRWLDREYWTDMHRARGDLQGVFPYPTGLDAERFSTWKRRAAADGVAPLMIDPGEVRMSSGVVRTGERRDGVNLVGYFKHQSGVSNIGRRVAAILERHGVPFTTVAYERTSGPRIEPEPPTDQRLEFANTIAFVNGDQFAHLHFDMPEVFGEGRTVAGMWFWELDTIEGGPPVGHQYADQIWAATRFVAGAFEHLPVEVEHVPVPFGEPESSGRSRADFGPLADADQRFLFGVVLDHLSITSRKNPVGAIRAFRQAFPTSSPDGPMLVVKTINARTCWADHERLLVEAAGRDDIVIWDELLPIADHVALIGSFDALVSLHRSEGLGLHLAEAMWLERPIIATRYSGNLDFMDAESALLIDADLVPVGPGLWPYPASARWAEPRLDDAVIAMRRLVGDPELCRRLGAAARATMLSMPSERAFVDRVRSLLALS